MPSITKRTVKAAQPGAGGLGSPHPRFGLRVSKGGTIDNIRTKAAPQLCLGAAQMGPNPRKIPKTRPASPQIDDLLTETAVRLETFPENAQVRHKTILLWKYPSK